MALCSLFVACMKDKGTYVYTDINEITIDTLGVHQIELLDTLRISMNVHQTLPVENLEYLWYYYPNNRESEIDTLGMEKDLEYRVELAPGTYTFYAQAKDTESGCWGKQVATVNVVGKYSSGIMMFGTVDGVLSLSMVNSAGKFYDIYSAGAGAKLGENPVLMGASPLEVLLFCEDSRGGVSLDAGTLLKSHDYSELFAQVPDVLKPQGYEIAQRDMQFKGEVFINDGDMYFRKSSSPQFSPKVSGNYYFSPQVIPFMDVMLVYDMLNTSFYSFDFGSDDYSLKNINTTGVEPFNPSHLGLKPIFWNTGNNYGTNLTPCVCGVFENEAGVLYRVIAKMSNSWMNGLTMEPFIYEEIPESSLPGFRESPSYEIYNLYTSVIFYARGNQLYKYDIGTGKPAEVAYDFEKEFPNGKINNIYSRKLRDGSGYFKSEQYTLYVTTSENGGSGWNGHLHKLKVKGDGDSKIEKIEETYKNVCGETVSLIYK